jgi:hypothetical protein
VRTTFVEGRSFGDPSVLHVETEELRRPQGGEILLRQHAVGVNFIDVLQRRGELTPTIPYRLGLEGAGEVLEVGPGVTEIAAGDRVVYAGGPAGAYASARLFPAARAVKLPAAGRRGDRGLGVLQGADGRLPRQSAPPHRTRRRSPVHSRGWGCRLAGSTVLEGRRSNRYWHGGQAGQGRLRAHARL